MQSGECQGNPSLRAIVAEASQALALLDTQRLEELALSCQALNRTLTAGDVDSGTRRDLARQASEASADMAVLGRVLDATRANVNVMKRLHEMHSEQLEYRVQAAASEWSGVGPAERYDGNH